jgi:hypothetical protein
LRRTEKGWYTPANPKKGAWIGFRGAMSAIVRIVAVDMEWRVDRDFVWRELVSAREVTLGFGWLGSA